ncbi:MAG: tyrosine--tRNA ligase [Bacilli bacterium]|nr:tyrosine--tRNA ligase [Bacilli bacterium]
MKEFKNNAFDILLERGFVFQATHLEETKKLLESGPITFYLGIDPTADDLHIGHFFALQMFKILQDCGHRGVLLVGGATAMIGDPSFKSDMRKLLTREEVDRNVREINSILHRFIDVDGDNPAIIVNNADWIREKGFVDFMRTVGIHFNVAQMLSADAYKKRLEQGGLTFFEMSYMLMQAFDFVHLNDTFDCVLEIGGSDQWGNIIAGVDLSRKMANKDGENRPLMMGLTCPLLTNANGVKMGKTEKGTLWVSREKSSSFEFFQHFVNCLDEDVERLLRFFTKLPISEIETMCKENIVEAKKLMAFEVTKLVHGEEEAIKVLKTSEELFTNKGLSETNMPSIELEIEQESISIIDLLTISKLTISKSEARRLVEQNGIEVNGRRAKLEDLINLKENKEIILKKGKKTFLKVLIK